MSGPLPPTWRVGAWFIVGSWVAGFGVLVCGGLRAWFL